MKRKGFRVLAAAVLMCGAFVFSAYAAEGWASENNTWIYLDKNGNRVTNEWKKGADNLWRYLDQNGEMLLNGWADGEYYVDSNGIMVENKWVQTQSPYDRDGETHWFYFANSGKMLRDCWKKIDGKNYLFDGEGVMETGWTDDGTYYLGTDGAMRTGWKFLEDQNTDDDESWSGPEDDEDSHWYYFGSNGKKYTSADTGEGDYRVVKIDGKYYCFDIDGKMQTGWVYMNGDASSADMDSIEDWKYYAEEGIRNATLGAAIQGWLSLEPPERLQNNVDEPVVWYYFEKDGTPKFGPKAGDASTSDFVKVDGKTYLFDQRGNPASGLRKVRIGDSEEYTSYYFDSSSKAAIKGKRTVEEGDGTKSTFYFNEGSNAGRGLTGVKDSYLYYMGKRQEADSDSRYVPISLPNSNGGYTTYVVNTAGRVSKNTTVKDRDGNKYTVNASGHLTKVNDVEVGSEKYNDPVEPTFDDDDF